MKIIIAIDGFAASGKMPPEKALLPRIWLKKSVTLILTAKLCTEPSHYLEYKMD